MGCIHCQSWYTFRFKNSFKVPFQTFPFHFVAVTVYFSRRIRLNNATITGYSFPWYTVRSASSLNIHKRAAFVTVDSIFVQRQTLASKWQVHASTDGLTPAFLFFFFFLYKKQTLGLGNLKQKMLRGCKRRGWDAIARWWVAGNEKEGVDRGVL